MRRRHAKCFLVATSAHISQTIYLPYLVAFMDGSCELLCDGMSRVACAADTRRMRVCSTDTAPAALQAYRLAKVLEYLSNMIRKSILES
jgi:hypothetical protein